jgi:hypothetical protein
VTGAAVALCALGALLYLSLPAAAQPASAGAATHVHILPTVTHQQSAGSRGANLAYHGGKVMRTSQTYAIFWEPPTLQDGSTATVSAQYNALNQQYFSDVGGDGLYNNNTQYYQIANGHKRFIRNQSSLAGAWVDTSAYPVGGCADPITGINCVSDAQIQAEVTHAMTVNGWTPSLSKMFFVFTSNGEGSCLSASTCAFSIYCAYHGHFHARTIYANMPYGATPVPGSPDGVCTTLTQFPNDHDADIEISITSHEHMEAVTDPKLNAWRGGSGGAEIGDKCAYNYGPITLDGGKANEKWNGHFYVVQQEWDNHTTGCVQEGP